MYTNGEIAHLGLLLVPPRRKVCSCTVTDMGANTKQPIICPSCKARLLISGTAPRIRCQECGSTFAAEAAQPVPPVPPKPKPQSNPGAAAAVCILAVIGLIMAFQPVTVMTGTGTPWIGVVIVGVSTAASFVLRGVPMWVRVVTSALLAVALLNVLGLEHQISQRRSEIGRTFRQ